MKKWYNGENILTWKFMSNFVTIENENEIKLKNLFNIAIFMGFLWMLFHFTIIFFFWLVLESSLLVWIFLWLWNLVAFLIDIPVWVIQKYIKPKVFLILSSLVMFLVTLIFLKFIYFEWIKEILPWWWSGIDKTISYLWSFLNSTLNIILLILAACCYWIIKEWYDVTTLSYIFNNSTPSEYASLISKYNIFYWCWAMLWLLWSWALLALNIKLAILILIFIIFSFIFFIHKFFDNKKNYIWVKDFKEIKNIKLDVIKWALEEKRNNIIKNINIDTLKEVSKTSKVIFLKPVEIKNQINYKEIIEFSKKEFLWFKNIIFSKPYNVIIIWSLIVICHFWFWDTFVSTFQVEFLDKIIWLNQWNYLVRQTTWLISWYLLLWLLIIPAFLLQDFFIRLSKKINIFKVILFWTLISSISMIFFWFVDKIYYVMFFWLLNSVWYAAVMPIAQATFSEKYNYYYAEKNNLKEIDTTVSAAPLKIVTNFVNVLWLVWWWALVWILWFNWFFLVFSIFLLSLFVFTIFNLKKLKKWDKEENISFDNDFI